MGYLLVMIPICSRGCMYESTSTELRWIADWQVLAYLVRPAWLNDVIFSAKSGAAEF